MEEVTFVHGLRLRERGRLVYLDAMEVFNLAPDSNIDFRRSLCRD